MEYLIRLTGHRGVDRKGSEAGKLLRPRLLDAIPEDVLPGIQLQHFDSSQQLVGPLQSLTGVFLMEGGCFFHSSKGTFLSSQLLCHIELWPPPQTNFRHI